MNIDCLPVVVALAFAASPLLATAQPNAPAPLPAASSPPALKPGPRLLTPEEKRDNATAPDLRIERQVTPQLTIPLGRKPVPIKPSEQGAARTGARAPPGAVNDAAARCDALADAQERAACRERSAADTKPR